MIYADTDGQRIVLTFKYDPYFIALVKTIPGARFNRPNKCWYVPLDFESARHMRKCLGENLEISPKLGRWGWQQVKRQHRLTSLAVADDADLVGLGAAAPKLHDTLRAYQRAAAFFIACCDNPLIADQPGLGKTLEVIAGILETGIQGPQLVIAPLTSLESVWEHELQKWQPYPVIVVKGDRDTKLGILDAAMQLASEQHTFWVVINHAMARYEKIIDEDDSMVEVPSFPALFEMPWQHIIVDECHKGVLNNPKTLTARGLYHLDSARRIAMSGTPIGGKPINLWGILHWLEPKQYSSKWRWAEQWLEIEDTYWGKKIHGIRKDKEDDFYKQLNPIMLRRTKAEVLPELPPKQYQELWVDMDPKQGDQYVKFAALAEITIEEHKLSATSILAEYTRLKQFACAEQKIKGFTTDEPPRPILIPTHNSCKLLVMSQILDELGIMDADTDEQCVVFSQFSKMIDMVTEWLQKKHVPAAKLTGETTQTTRKLLQQKFQAAEYSVLCMTTTAGGTAITLDRASTCIFLDETWNPDDQEQAEDRIHRASRIHQVMVYRIKTKDTLEEYIEKVLKGKSDINRAILDLRRQGVRSTGL